MKTVLVCDAASRYSDPNEGLTAQQGYSPATGLGSVNVTKLVTSY